MVGHRLTDPPQEISNDNRPVGPILNLIKTTLFQQIDTQADSFIDLFLLVFSVQSNIGNPSEQALEDSELLQLTLPHKPFSSSPIHPAVAVAFSNQGILLRARERTQYEWDQGAGE